MYIVVMMEYDLHTQNHKSDENSSSLLNSCLSRCQALITRRRLQSAHDPDICCDPGTAGFLKHSHSPFLGSLQRLRVTCGMYFGVLILKVRR